MFMLEFGPKTADKKNSEDGGCVETTAVIHRTHLNRAPICSARFVSVFGRIGSYVAVCPFFFSTPLKLNPIVNVDLLCGDSGDSGDEAGNIGVGVFPVDLTRWGQWGQSER